MAQTVSRRPLTAESRFRSLGIPCEICGGQNGTGTVFSPNTSVPPVSIIPPVRQTFLHIHIALNRRTKGRDLGNFQKAVFLRKSASFG